MGYFLFSQPGVCIPSPWSIGIIMLAGKREIISWNQGLAGKILRTCNLELLRPDRLTRAFSTMMGRWDCGRQGHTSHWKGSPGAQQVFLACFRSPGRCRIRNHWPTGDGDDTEQSGRVPPGVNAELETSDAVRFDT